MIFKEINNYQELIDYIDEIGFLPLLNLGVAGWSADDVTDEDCGYTVLPDGGWEWPLWQWKGDIIRATGCAYGKFINRKATFISKDWWPDFCNYRRSLQPHPVENSTEWLIMQTLREGGSMITRDLRRACGFTGTKMRGKFDALVARLQMQGYIVTADFVYPHDRHGKEYGWGWSLLTTPEALFGRDACHPDRTPEQSYERILSWMRKILPDTDDRQLLRLIG